MPRLYAPDKDVPRKRAQSASPPGKGLFVSRRCPSARAPLPLLVGERDKSGGTVESRQSGRIRKDLYDGPFGVIRGVGLLSSTLLLEERPSKPQIGVQVLASKGACAHVAAGLFHTHSTLHVPHTALKGLPCPPTRHVRVTESLWRGGPHTQLTPQRAPAKFRPSKTARRRAALLCVCASALPGNFSR